MTKYIVKVYSWPGIPDKMFVAEADTAAALLRQTIKGTIPNWTTILHTVRNAGLPGAEADNAQVVLGSGGIHVWNYRAKEYPVPSKGKATMIRRK